MYAREDPAPLLNESLRGTNAAEFSNSYFRQYNFLSLAPGFALHQRAVGGCQAYSINPVSEHMWEGLSSAAQLLSQPNTAVWDGISSPGLPLLYQRDGHWAFLTGCSWLAGHASGRISVISVSSSGKDLVAASSRTCCGDQQVLLRSTTTERFMYKHHNKNSKVAVLATLAFQ